MPGKPEVFGSEKIAKMTYTAETSTVSVLKFFKRHVAKRAIFALEYAAVFGIAGLLFVNGIGIWKVVAMSLWLVVSLRHLSRINRSSRLAFLALPMTAPILLLLSDHSEKEIDLEADGNLVNQPAMGAKTEQSTAPEHDESSADQRNLAVVEEASVQEPGVPFLREFKLVKDLVLIVLLCIAVVSSVRGIAYLLN